MTGTPEKRAVKVYSRKKPSKHIKDKEQSFERTEGIGLNSVGIINLNEQSSASGLIDLNLSWEGMDCLEDSSFASKEKRPNFTSSHCEALDLNKQVMHTDDGESICSVSDLLIEANIPFLEPSQSSIHPNPILNNGRQKPRRKRYRPKIDNKPMTPKLATPKQVKEPKKKKPKLATPKEKKPKLATPKRGKGKQTKEIERKSDKSFGLNASVMPLETNSVSKAPVARCLDFHSEGLDVQHVDFLVPNKKKRSKRRRKLNLFGLIDGRVTKNSKKRVFAINWIRTKRSLRRKRPHKVTKRCNVLLDEKLEQLRESSVLPEKSETVTESNVLPDEKLEDTVTESNVLPDEKLDTVPKSNILLDESEEEVTKCLVMDGKFEKLFNATMKKFSQLFIDEFRGKRKLKAKGRKGHLKLSAKGSIVLYQGPFDPLKKKKKNPAQIDLDSKTLEVWKLLMDKDDKRSDQEKAREDDKWKTERECFHKRIVSFNSRMHIIQGNRKFRKWDGSVLDSVVGVFLTQNVTDRASSNAFLSLAAKYPAQPTYGESLRITYNQESIVSTMEVGGNQYFINEPGPEINKELERATEERNSLQIVDITSMFKPLETSQDANSYSTQEEAVEVEMGQTFDASHCNQENFQSQQISVGAPVFPVVQSQKVNDDTTSNGQKKGKGKGKEKPPKEMMDWDGLRRKYSTGQRSSDQMDSVNWEAVRLADPNELIDAIKFRGQHAILARKIQKFLNLVVDKHKCLDLEWLRNTPPDIAKKVLTEVDGLGPKSVECIQLLSLGHVAFPVDTNVARITVRLGWVPLRPLPGDLLLHLLEEYPLMDKIQQYLWPRLCTLDHETLYELHYQMITFGKVFCTKIKPNCNACPMRGECKHFASEWSARNALPAAGPSSDPIPSASTSLSEAIPLMGFEHQTKICEPIIEEPFEPQAKYEAEEESGEPEFEYDSDEIPVFRLNVLDFNTTLSNYMKDGDVSKALVALTPEAASRPARKLKNVDRLRTEHLVFEVPWNHILIQLLKLERAETKEDVQYHLAIWTPGETAHSTEPTVEENCKSTESELCYEETCFKCNNIREHNANIVRATILIPCRVACRSSFPLNGTYFQHNEVFADHETSLRPFNISRKLISTLTPKIAFFGVSSKMMNDLTGSEVRQCFWNGVICVRGFDRRTRSPQALVERFHCKYGKKKIIEGEESVRRKTKKSGQAAEGVKNVGKQAEQMRPMNEMLSQSYQRLLHMIDNKN